MRPRAKSGGLFRRASAWALSGFLLAGVALPAEAAPRRVTAAEIRDIAQREMLWCERYEDGGKDCDVVTLKRLLPDGRLAETSTLLLQDQPRLQVYIADFGAFEDDRLCTKMDSASTGFSFTLDGRPLEAAESLGLRLLFMAQMTEFEGKTLCQGFWWGDEPNEVVEEITVDGERRPDLESTYMLHDGDTGLNLRPQVSPDNETTAV